MIGIGNVIFACVVTGLFTLWLGRPGLIGSLLGQIIYYSWLHSLLFG